MKQENPWQKIDLQKVNGPAHQATNDKGEILAPFDGERIDILAKKWEARTDTFRYRRFIDCEWDWDLHDFTNIDNGWHPEYWMTLPTPPVNVVVIDKTTTEGMKARKRSKQFNFPPRPDPSEPFTKA